MNGYLLFALHPASRISMGDNVTKARKAGRPSSRFEICHSGVKGIRPTSPAPPINAKTGAATKKNLSAFLGMNNSLKANLIIPRNADKFFFVAAPVLALNGGAGLVGLIPFT